ncbi:FlgB family protein [Roseovarius sp. 2305UL8-3]|uniref:FlgB family protein n=1 Tax=Roseovarius conchicola TaxID=3121636 RepID=UPI0035291B25
MFENLDVFRMAHAMSVHAATKQGLSAQNMANADTPGYVARDVTPFTDLMKSESAEFGLKATRAAHLNGSGQTFAGEIFERDGERDPNGNSVSLEIEMMHAVNAKRQHDRALSIYKTSLGVLRTAIGRP